MRPSHVWSIRTKLQIEGRNRDLTLFDLAIDIKLPGCDVVALRVNDVAPNGYGLDRATVRQKKTGRPVRFELTDQTRQAIDERLRLTSRRSGQVLFAGRDPLRGLTTRQHARLVGGWLPASDSIRASSARTRCVARRRYSSTGGQAIYRRPSFAWALEHREYRSLPWHRG